MYTKSMTSLNFTSKIKQENEKKWRPTQITKQCNAVCEVYNLSWFQMGTAIQTLIFKIYLCSALGCTRIGRHDDDDIKGMSIRFNTQI